MMTQETIPVKIWGGFNLTILKVNMNPLWKKRSFTIGFRPLIFYCYSPIETYWHNHVQAPRPRTPFLDSPASTSTPACVSCTNLLMIILNLCKGKLLKRSHKRFTRTSIWATLKRFWVQNPKYKWGTRGTQISLK